MLDIDFSLKFFLAVIFSVNTYEQDIIALGNENKKIKNKDRWNYCHRMPMLPLLGDNHRLPLFHMDKHFIWLEKTGERINEFEIGYMINPRLNVNISFKEQVGKYMNTKFGELTQPFIKTTL